VQIPASEGDMTAMPDHSPLITTLRPGIVKVTSKSGTTEFVVTGGFAEINGSSISILAERALTRDSISQDEFKAMIDEAKARLSNAQDAYQNEPGPVDEAAKLLSDMVAIGDEIGLSAN
jgi:F-type H+-transporting ATPase subunit epsilon